MKLKKSVLMLTIALAAAGIFTSCKGKTQETTGITEQMTETVNDSMAEKVDVKAPTEVAAATVYTSKDRTMSIRLPDATWKNTRDAEDILVFESAGVGSITVNHISGVAVTQANMPVSKEDVLANLQRVGKDTTKYQVLEFTKTSVGNTDKYYTTVQCTDMAEKFVYTVGYDMVMGTDLYSITGAVEKADEAVLKAVKDSVATFQVLKQVSATKKQPETQKTTEDQTGKSMTIYDENGKPIQVTKGADGVWRDSSGNTYVAEQYGLIGSDGYWYTYEAPKSDTGTPLPETGGFIDRNGNYVTVTKNADGNWVGPDGTIYYITDNSIKDDKGNEHKVSEGAEISGFYKAPDQYVTVTQDANGNWVDSSGVKYTFGDTGVTDEYGNFYPY